MEFYYYLSLIFSLLLVKLEAVPVKSTDHSNVYLQSLGLRLGVLQDIANQMVLLQIITLIIIAYYYMFYCHRNPLCQNMTCFVKFLKTPKWFMS